MEKTPSSHIIHSLGDEHCWIVRDTEPIRLLRSPRSLSVYILVVNYLDFRCYFEANGQNYIHFPLIQVLKNRRTWHFLTFTSPSSKLEFVYPPCSWVEEQMLMFSSSLTLRRVKGSWNPIRKLTMMSYSSERLLRVLNLIRPLTVLKKICHKGNSWVWAANDARSHPRTSLSCSWRMHSGKKLRSALCTLVKCNAFW